VEAFPHDWPLFEPPLKGLEPIREILKVCQLLRVQDGICTDLQSILAGRCFRIHPTRDTNGNDRSTAYVNPF